ncbi:3-hydroxyacyl-CoA dehydrogenase NAD-binding domain-containing protein, partial [Acinetobacter baumannii]
AEAKSLAALQQNATAKNLVRVFFLQNRLKALGKQSDVKVQHVHVIGAGTMGGDIAAWCALKGYQVTLQDKDEAMIGKSIGRAAGLFKKKL